MKKLVLGLLGVGFASSLVFAGPASNISTIIKDSNIKNKSELKNSEVNNVGIDQKNAINTVKVRKGSAVVGSDINNKAKMTGSKVSNVGIGQDNSIGTIDIGGE